MKYRAVLQSIIAPYKGKEIIVKADNPQAANIAAARKMEADGLTDIYAVEYVVPVPEDGAN